MTTTVQETRCRHDMLPGQCSVCRGMPWRPPVMYDSALLKAESDDIPELDDEKLVINVVGEGVPLRWIPSETSQECSNCGSKIREREPAAYVVALEGAIGMCCKDEVE